MTQRLTTFLLLALLAAHAAWADPITFAINFSGAAYDGNAANAKGFITFDGTQLANPGRNLYDPSGSYSNYGTATPGLVLGLTLNVTGATSGNGAYTLADFDAVLFDTSLVALNFAQQLVGQTTVGGNWGEINIISGSDPAQSSTGDFQLFAKAGSGAPDGLYPFQIGTAEGNGDGLQLVSMEVPEPASLSLFALGALALGRFGKQRGA